MTSRSIGLLDPRLQPLANQFVVQCMAEGYHVIITQTYRSNAEQDADYAQGRTTPGKIITKARAGQSPHNCTLPDGTPAARAFDFAIQYPDGDLDWSGADQAWTTVIGIGEALGLVSGSTFPAKDNDHMELPDWKTA